MKGASTKLVAVIIFGLFMLLFFIFFLGSQTGLMNKVFPFISNVISLFSP